MSTLVDSEAQFNQRMKDLKVSEGMQRKITNAGFTSFGVLAYAHGQPGQSIVDSAFEAWVSAHLDSAASLADVSCVKRLLFESQTLVLASLKEQVTGLSSESSVKKLPNAEREARLNIVKAQLSGLLIEGALEPGHSLIDLCASMHQSNEIKYIAPERCVSRFHEIMNQKTPTKQLDIAADTLVIKEHKEVPDSIAHSAMQINEAFVRRGVALLCADLVTHTNYTRYISTLFNHMHRDPPVGYSRCTVSQIVSADKAVWQKLLQDNVKPRRQPDGTLALDDSLQRALESYEVSFCLLPLHAKKDGNKTKEKKEKKETDKTEKPNKVKQDEKKTKGPKGKGKGRVPEAIMKLGGVARNPSGENLCYAFNINGCSEAADGAKCRRGLHVCAKCFGPHSIQNHENH